MITIEMLRDAIANEEMTWTDYREAKKELREDLEALETVFDETRDGSVTDSVAAMVRDSCDRFFSRYGFHCTMTGAADRVRDLVASLVNRSAWDGRLSPAVKAWAESREDAADAELADKMELYTRIHMAHLDQIAAALMAYTPDEETADEIPEEDVNAAVAEAVAESIPSFTVLYDYRRGGEYIPQRMTVNAETAADAVALVKELYRMDRAAGRAVSFPYHVRVEGDETAAPRAASAAVSVARVTAPVVVDREQERAAVVASRIMDHVKNYAAIPVEALAVCLSDGNEKVGHIKNVSQAPVVSCSGVCGQCGGHCYDGRAVIQYPGTSAARARNWSIYTRDPDAYFSQILAAVQHMRRRFFRWHVGGEIVDSRYFDGMVAIARAVPRVTFLVFTKRHALINDFCAEHGREAIPDNLRVIFSAWPGSPLVNPYSFPVSAPYYGDRPRGWTGCPGNCETCAEHGRGCWTASAGDVIGFRYHGAIADDFEREFSAWTAPKAREA